MRVFGGDFFFVLNLVGNGRLICVLCYTGRDRREAAAGRLAVACVLDAAGEQYIRELARERRDRRTLSPHFFSLFPVT